MRFLTPRLAAWTSASIALASAWACSNVEQSQIRQISMASPTSEVFKFELKLTGEKAADKKLVLDLTEPYKPGGEVDMGEAWKLNVIKPAHEEQLLGTVKTGNLVDLDVPKVSLLLTATKSEKKDDTTVNTYAKCLAKGVTIGGKDLSGQCSDFRTACEVNRGTITDKGTCQCPKEGSKPIAWADFAKTWDLSVCATEKGKDKKDPTKDKQDPTKDKKKEEEKKEGPKTETDASLLDVRCRLLGGDVKNQECACPSDEAGTVALSTLSTPAGASQCALTMVEQVLSETLVDKCLALQGSDMGYGCMCPGNLKIVSYKVQGRIWSDAEFAARCEAEENE